MATQTRIDLGEPRQNAIAFPLSLAEKYQPRLKDYIGLSEPKRIFMGLLKKPRPCSLLCVGAPGTGKTTAGVAFSNELPGALVHTAAQKCDVAQVDALWDRFAYMPAVGRWWIALVDEADQASDKAQLALLSKLDGSAALKPLWGGGVVRGEAPPIIWIFTSNGIGPDQIRPPLSLLPRFTSRCLLVPFTAPTLAEIAKYLQRVWKKEGGRSGLPFEYFMELAQGVGVRDALMRLDVELLRNPLVREVKARLAEKAAALAAKQNGEAEKWSAANAVEQHPDVQAAIAAYEEAVRAKAPEREIAAKKAWVTIRRNQVADEQAVAV